MSAGLTVLKVGGSILAGAADYTRAATVIAERVERESDTRFIVVVSAELGATDALLADARRIVEAPDPATLDLLWSVGEIKSVALLTLALHAAGVDAVAANVHQTGLTHQPAATVAGAALLQPLRLRALLASHDVVVAPGFLARGAADSIASLGRGGSDLTAVLLAAGLGAARCELLKDVAGYFTADPKDDPEARPIPSLTFSRALDMADDGCALVQRAALAAALEHGVELVVSGLGSPTQSRVIF